MSTTCLLCLSPAVADCLCTPCGTKKWWAEVLIDRPASAAGLVKSPTWMAAIGEPRANAIRDIEDQQAARAFRDRLEAARKAREAAPLCSRGCVSHEEKR